MSYILDALKKSDQERQQGTTPGLHTPQSAPPPERKKRPVWPYLLSAALLLNGGILAGWLWSRGPQAPVASSEGRTVAANAPGSSNVKMPSPDKATPMSSETTVVSAPRANAPAVNAGEPGDKQGDKKEPLTFKTAYPKAPEMQGGSSLQSGVKETDREDRKKAMASAGLNGKLKAAAIVPAAPLRQPAGGPGRESTAGAPGRSSQKTADAQVRATPVSPRTSSSHNNIAQQNHARISGMGEDRPSPPAPVESQPSPHPPAPVPAELPAAPQPVPPQQLPAGLNPSEPMDAPASLQREMSGMSLSFLVYSDNAAERMVSINGKMMREGQDVSPDMKLDEITPNGVILNYRGHRFHKDLF